MIGRAGSRTLAVFFDVVREVPGGALVVTARDATPSEKRLLERRGKGLR